jgi:hypothetical protein
VHSAPAQIQMKTGPRFPIWQSEDGSKTESLNETTVSVQMLFRC